MVVTFMCDHLGMVCGNILIEICIHPWFCRQSLTTNTGIHNYMLRGILNLSIICRILQFQRCVSQDKMPGSVHDASVLRASSLYRESENLPKVRYAGPLLSVYLKTNFCIYIFRAVFESTTLFITLMIDCP